MKKNDLLLFGSLGIGLVILAVLFYLMRPNVEVDRFGISDRPEVQAIPEAQRDAIYYEWRQDGKRRAKSWMETNWMLDLDRLYEQKRDPEKRDLFVVLTYNPQALAVDTMKPLEESQWGKLGLRATIDLETENDFRRLSPLQTLSGEETPEDWLLNLRKMVPVVAIETLETKVYKITPDGQVNLVAPQTILD